MSTDRTVWNSAFRSCLIDTLTPLGCFSAEEIEDMCAIAFAHGLEARGGYYKEIFDKYFAGKNWEWAEQIEWEKKFNNEDKWPESLLWKKNKKREKLQKYQDLMEYIDGKSLIVAECVRLIKMGIYSVELVFSSEMGENDRLWIRRQLQENPNALPPFFPCDKTIIKPVINAYEKRKTANFDRIIIQLPRPQKAMPQTASKPESWWKRGLKAIFRKKP